MRPSLTRRGLAHTINRGIGDAFAHHSGKYEITPHEGRPCSAFPNVFHPKFEAHVVYRAKRDAAPNRGDPWLIGYYFDNELAWWGRGSPDCGLFDAAMAKAMDHPAKREVCRFLREQSKDDLAAFNRTWGTALADWDRLLSIPSRASDEPEHRRIKTAFLAHAAEIYFSVLARAIRAADPDHLLLGARFAGTQNMAPVAWEAAGRHCDAVSLNMYLHADLDEGRVYTRPLTSGEPIDAHLARYHRLAGRPLLITEWSFPAIDSGLPCVHSAG